MIYTTYKDIFNHESFQNSLYSQFEGLNENQTSETLFATSLKNIMEVNEGNNPKINIVLIKQLVRIQFSKKLGYGYYYSKVLESILKGTENAIHIQVTNSVVVELTWKSRLTFLVLTDSNHATPSTLTLKGIQTYQKIASNESVIRPLLKLLERFELK